ncbi:MAG: efflux RND transporter periplasmic adaptor subunit [Vicinamibacteria bacterium]|nr:efflux RND transporter periplasmic adaptor subunit [Vicinamibacteria bacterium]
MSEHLKRDLASLRIDHDAPRPRRRWPLLLLLPAALLLLGVYGLRLRGALAEVPVSVGRATLETEGAPQGGAPVLTASGYVVARRKAVVSAKIQGRLAWLGVEEASRVREGQVIARLEDADYLANVQSNRANVQRAEADLAEQARQRDVAERLHADKVLDADTLAAARSRVRIAEAALAQAQAGLAFAEAQLQNTQIKAPFAGTVVKKMAEVGESVAPIPPGVNISTASGAIVALADLATLEVEADVSESNVARLGDAQPAEVTVEAFPDRRYKAVLRQVIPTADRTKATVQVKVTILDKDEDLKPEMSARVNFTEPAPPAGAVAAVAAPSVVIPKDAVATRDGKKIVFEVVQGALKQRAIETGAEREGRVVVRQGLAGGETVVLKPAETLKDGDKVKVQG